MLSIACALIGACLMVGCESKSNQETAITSEQVKAQLAKADAFDGTVDKVVHRCAPCGLGMDGSAEHALEMEGYTMHFCSAGCLEGYSKDPKKSVMSMTVPGK